MSLRYRLGRKDCHFYRKMKNKKPLFIALLALDIAVTLGLAIFNIIMLANTVGKNAAELSEGTGLIGYLQKNPTIYLVAFVIPLFVLLAGNIIGLVVYVRKSTKKEPIQVDDLTDEQREALRKELLAELQKPEE